MQKITETQFTSRFTELDILLFRQGKHYRLYEKLGSHVMTLDGVAGTYFAVWAPAAQDVSVMGDFNNWNRKANPLFPRLEGSGIWEGFLPGVKQGDIYKYALTSYDGRQLEKGDPYAFHWETPPHTGSIVWDIDYKWKDKKWMTARKKKAGKPQPYSVYEIHAGSWKRHTPEIPYSYLQMAEEMVAYVKEMNYTHVEFMPVAEHPYDPSWGYQVTGYFAPTSRFGTPQDFMTLVEAFHKADIGVILDWVPSHFPSDAHGLADFDGTHLYNHADPRKGFHPDWKTYIFNLGRNEVKSFLISNALFWLDKYHIDGLRVDAVASMLYLDYSREDGQWEANEYGGNENLEAIEFLKEFNTVAYGEYPDVVTIAEESTAFSGVSAPVYDGGLGFGQKWMMGWMHDTLNYFSRNPIYRSFHQNDFTFSAVYAFSENFMLPLSHDEVVHGKASLIGKMPGDEWQRFANLRTMYGYMMTHPGTKLMFMGGEFAQTTEWNFRQSLEWWLLQYEYHKGIQELVKDLNALYRDTPALYEKQFEQDGFEWIDIQDHKNSIAIYKRMGTKKTKPIIVVCNLTPIYHEAYKVGVPYGRAWTEILNTDHAKYGGSGKLNQGKLKPVKEAWHNQKQHLEVNLAPLSVMVFG